jgi:hypothetical protein
VVEVDRGNIKDEIERMWDTIVTMVEINRKRR